MIALALHGGAGAKPGRDYSAEMAHMAETTAKARQWLQAGKRALDVVAEVVTALEDSGLYVAGKGASPNLAGAYELDASIMDGREQRAGAVAALQGFANPILVARSVMEKTPHVMLAGAGAADFARTQGFEALKDEASYFTRAARQDANYTPGVLSHGTVGCVCLDSHGDLAAATSTAGVFGKLHGRVGDTPIIGAGTYADNRSCAVSATGHGEIFIRNVVAHDIAARIRFGGQSLAQAVHEVVREELPAMQGEGGVIAIDRNGEIVLEFNSEGMFRASQRAGEAAFVGIYR